MGVYYPHKVSVKKQLKNEKQKQKQQQWKKQWKKQYSNKTFGKHSNFSAESAEQIYKLSSGL